MQTKGISKEIFKSLGNESGISFSSDLKQDTKQLRELREEYDDLPENDPRGREILDQCWKIIGFNPTL